MTGTAVEYLRSLPAWAPAIEALRRKYEADGDEAHERAAGYGELYASRRAAMVVDVVASRQRRYERRVLPMVQQFDDAFPGGLAELGAADLSDVLRLRRGETDTIRAVAAGLAGFAAERGLGDDEGSKAWAAAVGPLGAAFRLDAYVGSVRGIGLALFCYLRMRCGADGLKPDLRLRRALAKLGFPTPDHDPSLLALAEAAAAELGVPRLVLDQLLWW